MSINIRTIVVALAFCTAFAFHLSATDVEPVDANEAIQKFLAQPTSSHTYRGSRRLEASGSGQQGWLDAHTDFTRENGFRYEVTAEGGSGYIRSRVLRSLLEEERRLIARGGADEASVSPANYAFAQDGSDENGLVRVALRPLRKERSLIDGRMFITSENGELVRVEGRLARNPSFWITRVNIVRSYRRINNVLVPVSLESTAQLRLLGRSSLSMTYHYSEVDEQPVSEGGLPDAR